MSSKITSFDKGNENKNKSGAGLSVIVGAGEDGMTARGVLRRAKGVSQRLVRKIAHSEGEGAGALFINGQPARFRDKVISGDEIRLVFPEEESWIEPEDIPLSVLYEDEDILVIDKQPGIVVHPTKGHRERTVAGAVVHHMRQRGESYKPRFISRLDMDTSGVLLIGKNSHAQDNLAKQSAAGTVEKYYIAVLEGRPEDDLPPSGVIDLPIGLAQPGEPKRAVIPEEKGGYPSRTEYEVLETVSFIAADGNGLLHCARNDKENQVNVKNHVSLCFASEGECQPYYLTVVRARLITGRTHQIRVHFAHFGHPVLGDQLYGSPTPLIARQALHATEIAFAHPVSGRPMRIESPLPSDISALLPR